MSSLNMSTNYHSRASMINSRHKHPEEAIVSLSTKENLADSLCMLAEELEAFGIDPVVANDKELQSVDVLTDVSAKLIDSSWQLIRKHRLLMRKYDQLNDAHSKISNDNYNLKNRVERLKDDLQKKQNALQQGLERERRLKVESESIVRDLKHEKDETLKLRKQLRSKDDQHEHELRRVMQSGRKLRDQLEKSIGSPARVTRDKDKVRTEDKSNIYKQTILRLEENNRSLLEEINELRETLALHSEGIHLQIEASGIWTDTET